ncbi:MAG: DUF3347 domain-containing protein [Bdellovibrionales bacterium]|nr:DUF3347 domain-containing protein [Bdellovibrionales bacterium]
MKEFVPGYISIQEALTADDLTLAQTKAKELQEQIQSEKGLKDIKSSLGAFQKTKAISDARKEFKKLSTPFVKWMESNKDSNFEVVYCPMAGAKWVQKKGEVSNPYFGKEMLHCGEKAS